MISQDASRGSTGFHNANKYRTHRCSSNYQKSVLTFCHWCPQEDPSIFLLTVACGTLEQQLLQWHDHAKTRPALQLFPLLYQIQKDTSFRTKYCRLNLLQDWRMYCKIQDLECKVKLKSVGVTERKKINNNNNNIWNKVQWIGYQINTVNIILLKYSWRIEPMFTNIYLQHKIFFPSDMS